MQTSRSATPTRLTFSAGTLLLNGMSHERVARVFESLPWKWDRRVAAWRCNALWYAEVRERLSRDVCEFRDDVANWFSVRWRSVKIHPLRAEQQTAVEAWQNTRRACIVMPTGTGKTEVALSIMAETAVSTLVVAPVRDLMYQWHRRIADGLEYDAGIIGDNVFRVKPVAVTTYDSACIHIERLGDKFGLIIFDECHHLPGQIRCDAARMSAAPMRMGLTATLERSDGRHSDLDWLIGPVAYDLPISAVRGQSLADYEVIRIPVQLSAEEQARYDQLSRQVREYVVERRKTAATFTWEDLCAESGSARKPGAR